jgi:NAD(P)-dependent dehydrogenase (short-subunit alcohol dehydrogenase family)
VAARWGRIDILVNNAGVSGITAVSDPDEAVWQQIIATNLTGMYVVTKLAVRHMKDHAHGRVLNLSSVLGRFGVPGYAGYCASKHGVIGLTARSRWNWRRVRSPSVVPRLGRDRDGARGNREWRVSDGRE